MLIHFEYQVEETPYRDGKIPAVQFPCINGCQMIIIEVIKARPDSDLSEQRSFEEVIVINDNHKFGAAPAPPPRGQQNNHK